MSTKSTIATGEWWTLYEELVDDTVVLRLETKVDGEIVIIGGRVNLSIVIPPEVLDKIAKFHNSGMFPHQQKNGE